MPIYEYACKKCGAHTEVMQKITDKPLTRCRKCKGRLEKLLSAPAIQFKGAGWYVTDYAGKKGEAAEEKKGAQTEASTSSNSTSTDKPASKDSAKKREAKSSTTNSGD